MAGAADTARLIATLELQDKFSGPARTAEGSLDRLEGKTRGFGRVGDEVGRGLGNLGRNLAIGAAAGVGVIAASVTLGLQSLVRLEEVQTATNEVIESTGGIANITAEKVRELAEEYENLNATIDDKVIQSAENLLLTFVNIGEKAFEPALEAALNLNQALGGGEEGLQGTIIQVGKALNDPVRGLLNLRRVGVQFSKEQEDQIKLLVEQNDLYGAQQIILQELTRQFGGQFAAAGDTAAGKFAKLKDVIEDSQMALATAFLPVLEKTADKLSAFLADPGTQRRITEFSETLAGGLDDVITFVGQLPWEAIGSAFELLGTGARAALDFFKQMPDWVQTAVLTGWGLNALTGGALGNIVGELGKGLIHGVLGMNAGVVNINAATVTGVPGGGVGAVPAAGWGGVLALALKGALGAGFAVSVGTAIGLAIGVPIFNSAVDPAKANFVGKIDEIIDSEDVTRIRENVAVLDAELAKWAAKPPQVREAMDGVIAELQLQRDRLAGALPVFGPPLPPFGSTPIGQFNPANMGGVRQPTLLPDTAMQPLLSTLGEIRDEIREQNESDEPGNFVPDVPLDPSRINDIRIETAQTSDRLAELKSILPTFLGGLRADVQDNKNVIAQRLATVASKADGTNLNLSAARSMLQIIGSKHDVGNARLTAIQNKNWTPQVYVTNQVSISATLLEQRLVQAKVAAQGTPTGSQFKIL